MITNDVIIAYLREQGQIADDFKVNNDALKEEIRDVLPDTEAMPGTLSWVSLKGYLRSPKRIDTFQGSLLLCPADVIMEVGQEHKAVIVPCKNPKIAFSRVVFEFFENMTRTEWPGIRDDNVHSDAIIGVNVTLNSGTVIGEGVTIGDNVTIGPNTVVAHTTIGNNVTIGANCSIGLTGYGYERDAETTEYFLFPHIGDVVISENVEIGSNTCIDRGSLGSTYIGKGTKIDNLVHVAHNVVTGRNCMLIANAMIGGSAIIEDGAWIAPSAALMNQVTIGEEAVVGLAAVVVKSVEAEQIVVGNPAKPLNR